MIKSRKVLMLGQMGVGKTSLSRRAQFDVFEENYTATIGVDIYNCRVRPSEGAEEIGLAIWDTDGERGIDVFREFYARKAQAAMIIADVTRPSTIDAMVELGRRYAEVVPGRYFAFVLNKIDLVDDIALAHALERITMRKVPIVQASAKTGENVAAAFAKAAAEILKLES